MYGKYCITVKSSKNKPTHMVPQQKKKHEKVKLIIHTPTCISHTHLCAMPLWYTRAHCKYSHILANMADYK